MAEVGVLAIATVVVACGFRSVYESWTFAAPVVFCVLAASATSAALARFRAPVGIALLASLVVFAVLGTAIVEATVPPVTIADFARTVTGSWRLMLDVTPPLAASGHELAVPVASSWFAAVAGAELTLRTKSTVLPLAGPASMLVVVVLFGVSEDNAVQRTGAALFALAVAFVLIRARARPGSARPTMAGRVVLVTGLVAAALAAPAVARNLPLNSSRERVTLRETHEPAFDPQQLASPLSLIKESLVEPMRSDRLFTITGPSIDRIRLAVLTEYDGVVFTMASTDRTAFRSVSSALPTAPGEPDSGAVETFRITIDALAGPWLPVPGSPVAVRTVPGFAQSELRFDPIDANLLSRAQLRSGQAYEIDARTITSYAADGPPPVLVESNRQDPPLTSLAASIIGDAIDSASQLDRLRAWFTTHGYYDPGARAGHTLDRLQEFTGDPDLLGFDEQYAATFAVLAQSVGLDARVVVGFEVGHSAGDTTAVMRADMKAWNEVRVDELGWVTVDVVPEQPKQIDDDVVASERDAGRLPEAPPLDEETVTSTTIPEIDEEEKADEVVARQTGLGVTPLTAAVAIGASALVLLAVVATGIVAIKGRRRRRRFRAPTTHARVTGAWNEFVDRSVDLGCAPAAGATIGECASKIAHDLAVADTQLAMLAQAAERAGFDPDLPTEVEVQRAWDELHRVERLVTLASSRSARARAVVRTKSLRRSPSRLVDIERRR